MVADRLCEFRDADSIATHVTALLDDPALRRATEHAYRYAPLSLDGPLPPQERLSGNWSEDPARIVSSRSERAYVRGALSALSPRQQLLLRLHYFGNVSLHQIGRQLEISPQRVSQLHLAALKKLRHHMRAASPAR